MSLVEELERAEEGNQASYFATHVARELQRLKRHPEFFLDKDSFDRIARAFERKSRKFAEKWQPPAMDVGMTYVLLEISGSDQGSVGYVRVERSSGEELFIEGVTRKAEIYIQKCLPWIVSALSFDDQTPFAGGDSPSIKIWHQDGKIDGVSLGLSLAIALASCCLEREPPSNVAASAEVAVGGVLKPVDATGLDAKLRALHAKFPNVTKLLVHTDQGLPEALPSDLKIVRCDTLLDALGEVALHPSPVWQDASRRASDLYQRMRRRSAPPMQR